MAVSSTLGLKVVITGVSQVISGLKSIDNAASGLGTVLKGVGKVGSGALKLLTAPLRAIGKVAGLAWKGLTAVAKSIWRIGEYVVGNLIARAITAIGEAIANLARDALQAAEDIQTMRIALEGLVAREMVAAQEAAEDLGGAFGGVRRETLTMEDALSQAGPRAEELLLQLRDIALISPYQFNQVEDTFRLAMAFGMGSEEAIKFTQATLDTAAGLGMTDEVMTRFVYNLAQAVIGGDLTAINLRQMRLTAFDLAGVLSDELGMSIEEVREGLEDGSLTLADVSDAFLNYADVVWAGAAERMSKTMMGLRNSFLDLFFFVGADTLTPLVEMLSDRLGTVFDDASEILETGVLIRIGEAIGEMAVKGLEMIPFDAIMKAMPTVLDAIALLLEGRFEDAWYTAMAAIQLVFGDEAMVEVHQYKDAYLAALATIQALLKGDFATAWEETKKVIIGVFGPEAQEPIALFEQAVAAIGAAIEIVKGILAGDIGLKDFVSPGMVEVIEAFEGLLQKIGEWFAEYGPGIKEAADNLFEKMREGGRDLAAEVLPWIVEKLEAFGAWFEANGPLINDVVLKIIDIFTRLSGKVDEWWRLISPLLDNFLTNMAGIITFLMNVFVGNWETVWTIIRTWATQIWIGIKTMIFDAVHFIYDVVVAVLNLLALWWPTFWEAFKLKAEIAWENLKEIVEEKVTLIKEWLVEQWELIKTNMIDVFDNMVKETDEKWAEVVAAIDEAITEAIATILGYVEDFLSAGAALIQGLIDGIKSKLAAVATAAASVARAAWDAVTNFAGIESPSTLFYEVGVNLVQGLIDGVESKEEEFADVMKGLFDVAGTLSGIGSFFSGVYERQKVDPLKAILKEMNDNMDAMAEHKRGLEEQIEAEQEQALRDAAALEIEGIEAAQDAQEEAIRATAEAQKDALNDAHSEMLTIIANEFDLRGDKIKEIIALQEDEQKTLYSDESDAIKRQYDDEELLFKDQISDEERAVKDLYDEKTALYNDAIDAEKRAIRERDDIEKEEMYLLLDDVDTRKRADILALNALEQAELDAIQQSERDGLREISDREDTALDASIAAKEAALAAIQQDEEDRIRVLAAKEQDAITEAIALYERRIDTADEAERVALETLIAQSEAQRDAITARMEEEIAIIEVRMAATEQEVRAEEIRLDIIRQIEEEERRILELKEKQDQLKMLDQQRKLLELIAEYELDAGSILEGLTLGLNADAGDVLDAMVGAMTGIIEALESTLEISSPSGVFRTIGQQMMAGMSEGIADLTPAVIAQINAAVAPVMGGGGSVTNNYYNNSQMSHNLTTQSITRPGALALEFDAMAMASR